MSSMSVRAVLGTLVTLLGVASATLPAKAGELIESYVAQLSSADHFNSNGERLTTVAAIIRQDRANFHRFGIRDSLDESDDFFEDKDNRALMEKFISRGRISKEARNAIVNGTPVIRVDIFREEGGDYIDVSVF